MKPHTSASLLHALATVLIIASTALICNAAPPQRGQGVSPAVADRSTWPRFRGPNGSGLSDAVAIPAQWTDQDYNWRTALPGGGHSSPVVWGDRIFLICGDDQTGAHTVVCVNAADGSIRWSRNYPARTYQHHQYNSYASSTPAVDDRHVYVCWSTPEEFSVLALDHDGKDIWRRELGPFVSQHGGGQSPIAFGNRVFVGDDQEGPQSFLFALDRDTGAIAWRVPRGHTDKFAAATPCIYQPRDGGGAAQVIFASKAHGFTAVDPNDGHVIWELNKIFDSRPVASPYIAGGLIFGSCGDGPSGHGLVAVRPSDDGRSAAVAWELHRSVPYVPTSVVKNGLLFYVTDNGVMTCLRAATGQSVWRQRLDGNFFGSLVCAGDKLFVLSKEGEVFVIAAADKFQQLARNPLRGLEDPAAQQPPLATTPAIAGGRMYVRTYTRLVSIGGR